jgi:drug/metabolite transporter (DMT)-like permease
MLPLLLLLAVGTLLGVFTVLVKAAIAAGWHPLAFLFWSLAGSGLIVAAVAVANGQPPRFDRRTIPYYLGAGLLSGALPNALSFTAIAHVGAGFVALCYAFPPLITYGLALSLGMERPRALRATGLLVGLFGAVLLVAAKVSVEGDSLAWLAIALIAPVVVASGNIFRSFFWPTGATPLSLAPGMLLAGALLLGPALMLAGVPLAPPPGAAALGLVLAEIAVFAAAFSLIFVLQALAGPVYLSQIGSVGAAAGAALAVVVLGETASPTIVLATAVILAGVALVNRTR